MAEQSNLGGSFTFPGTSFTIHRLGYGAMRLSGPGIYGPPRDTSEALAVLRDVVANGIDHIDTSDFYGPHVTNQLIRQALHPYPENLLIVTKVGAVRGADKSWNQYNTPAQLVEAVHDNLRNLGLESLQVVNFRVWGHGLTDDPVTEQVTALAELKQKGLIQHIGISNATPKQLAEAQKVTEIVCVQNEYNLAQRTDDAFIEDLAAQGIPYVPYFPLGGFTPLQSSGLDKIAAGVEATPMQVALAWLLQRSPNILLIPGTSSVEHLRENIAAADLKLPETAVQELDRLAASRS